MYMYTLALGPLSVLFLWIWSETREATSVAGTLLVGMCTRTDGLKDDTANGWYNYKYMT